MPEIKLKHIVSCSSEDTTHKADNLLSSDTYRKWKAARPGEKQTSVILQFEKEEQVHSIDIGNEGSAFIEVLVGHSTSVRDQDFEVLLVTSSFMSPSESRAGTNTNRVRFFGPQQLVKANAQEKWDRVKIVCSQPYSKTIAYGVAFIKFHSPPDNSDTPTATPPKLTKLGQFRVKDESPSSGPSLQPGSLFFNRDAAAKDGAGLKVSPQNAKLSYAAATLQSESSASNPPKASSPQAPVKRKFQFSKERQEAPGPPAKKPSLEGSPQATSATSKAKPSAAHTPSPNTTKGKAAAQKTPEKKAASVTKPKARSKTEETVPLHKIMEGVVFVLSGFQNPFRGELRDKALAMGAHYRPDWTPDSTHLICAFANTPKYSQVKAAGGLIVRKEWVLDCHKHKQKISFKRYLMDGAESSSEESAPEDNGRSEEKKKNSQKSPEMKQSTIKKLPEKDQAKTGDQFGGSTDDGGEDGTLPIQEEDEEDSGMDTEDELRRVEAQRKERDGKVNKEDSMGITGQPDMEADPYGGSTDENTDAEEEQEDKPIPELPDFLTGKRFFLYGKFAENQRRLLQRYIIAFNGAVEDYMSEKVQFVITSQGWDDAFEEALLENENLSFVKPSWIFAINDRQKMLPYQPYTVVP